MTRKNFCRSLKRRSRWGKNRPVLIDKFISDAIEVDVDAVSDGAQTMICGIMEHIEEAGIHSGDSACVLPPHTLSDTILAEIRRVTINIANELKVVGLLNIQYAIKEDVVFILEVNPRASRTVPFVSKAMGVPWAKIAAQVMVGVKLADIPEAKERVLEYFAVKESVLPFNKFPGADTVLGPEMKSTGEVMGIDKNFGLAFAKSQEAAGTCCRDRGLSSSALKTACGAILYLWSRKSPKWASRSARPRAPAKSCAAMASTPRWSLKSGKASPTSST